MGRTQHTNRSDRTDKLAEAHDRLAAAVEALVSGDDWQSFLTMAAKLHGYSTGNHGILEPSEWSQSWRSEASDRAHRNLLPCCGVHPGRRRSARRG